VKYLFGNWKMHTTISEAVALAGKVEDAARDLAQGGRTLPEIVICPPFVSLTAVSDVIDDKVVKLGAQTSHWEESGAFTGEVAAAMLAGLAEFVLVGHSERRKAGETDHQVAQKLGAAVAAGLTPVLCVGESDPHDNAPDYTEDQLRSALAEVAERDFKLLVAYEPSWEIGGDQPAEVGHVDEVAERLRTVLDELKRPAAILYGGSITAESVRDLLADKRLDGFLVGHASLDPAQFTEIAREVADA
jgi:triosephosphate isomerase